MDFLVDTNILIPIEPASGADVETLSGPISDLVRQIHHTGNRVVIHPRTFEELARDRDPIRRKLRLTLAAKYVRIENPPEPGEGLLALLSREGAQGHDAFDICLLAAVAEDKAAFLITQDAGLHARAARLGIADRVLTVSDASDMVRTLYEAVPAGPAPVQPTTCDGVDPNDPMFAGLRSRYADFDGWWAKAVAERRRAWVIRASDGGLAAICVIVEKPPGRHGLWGKLLKLCTFKVSDDHSGYRYGELLLKAVFEFAEANNYDALYVEVAPDLELLIAFLDTFGFVLTDERKPNGDVIMVKRRRPSRDDLASMAPLDLHIRFGPPVVVADRVSSWLVPIEPRYHARLFPEAEAQTVLMPGREAHGNSIRKAYLSRASARSLRPGDLVYFYKSMEQTVSVVGIVEDVGVLSRAQDIVRTAGKRTVYTAAEIEELLHDGREVLVIGFRQVLVGQRPVVLANLRAHLVASAPPQTIQGIPREGAAWLAQSMGL